jgi:hypothetical protein
MATTKADPSEHPAPARHAVAPGLLLYALAAAPTAWLFQTVFGMAVARHACYPKDTPLAYAAFGYAQGLLGGAMVAATAVAFCAVAASLFAWKKTGEEKGGDGHTLLEIGEGRTRFLAMCAVILSIGFSFAIGFSALGLAIVPLC